MCLHQVGHVVAWMELVPARKTYNDQKEAALC